MPICQLLCTPSNNSFFAIKPQPYYYDLLCRLKSNKENNKPHKVQQNARKNHTCVRWLTNIHITKVFSFVSSLIYKSISNRTVTYNDR